MFVFQENAERSCKCYRCSCAKESNKISTKCCDVTFTRAHVINKPHKRNDVLTPLSEKDMKPGPLTPFNHKRRLHSCQFPLLPPDETSNSENWKQNHYLHHYDSVFIPVPVLKDVTMGAAHASQAYVTPLSEKIYDLIYGDRSYFVKSNSRTASNHVEHIESK